MPSAKTRTRLIPASRTRQCRAGLSHSAATRLEPSLIPLSVSISASRTSWSFVTDLEMLYGFLQFCGDLCGVGAGREFDGSAHPHGNLPRRREMSTGVFVFE